ncbi:MAG: flagellar hook protein FlgE [Phenylobacterium sp.]
MDPISTARAGLLAAGARLEASARRTAEAGDATDYLHEAVEQIQAGHAFTANVQVVKFADAMWRSLLEIQSDERERP